MNEEPCIYFWVLKITQIHFGKENVNDSSKTYQAYRLETD